MTIKTRQAHLGEGKPSSNTHATRTVPTCHQLMHAATHSWSLPHVPAPSSNIPAATSPKGEQIPCPSDGRVPSSFSTPFPVQAAATDTSSPSKAARARAPGGPRSSSPKLPVNPRSSGNDQANCFEEDFVPAVQLATQKLRINCKPSKTLGKPKINTAKEEHFPLESHGQVVSLFWAGSQEAAQIHLLCHSYKRLSFPVLLPWCFLPTWEKKGPLFRHNGTRRAGKRSPGRRIARAPAATSAPHRASSQGSGPPSAAHRRGCSLGKTGIVLADLGTPFK